MGKSGDDGGGDPGGGIGGGSKGGDGGDGGRTPGEGGNTGDTGGGAGGGGGDPGGVGGSAGPGDPGGGGGGGDPGGVGGSAGPGDPGGDGGGGDPGGIGGSAGPGDPGGVGGSAGPGDPGGGPGEDTGAAGFSSPEGTDAPDIAARVSEAGPAGAPSGAGGGYGDPLAASDPSNVLSASRGDVLGPQDALGGGDPFSVEGADPQADPEASGVARLTASDSAAVGSVPPTDRASAGSMLTPDNERAAADSAAGTLDPTDRASAGDMLDPENRSQADYSEAAARITGGTQDSEPGSQLPSSDFQDAPTPGPAMSPGTEQADTLAGQQFAELGQSDVPLSASDEAPATFQDRFAPAEDLEPAQTGSTQATDRASQGDMLDEQSLADKAARDRLDRAVAELGVDSPDAPGSQLPSFDQRYSGVPAPASGETASDQANWWSKYGEAPDDVERLPPLGPYREIAQKDQEQAPGPPPGGVGSTESAVPGITSSDIYPMNLGGYAGSAGQTVLDPGAAARYDAANPPGGGFSSYAPGGLFLGADAGLLATGAPIGTGAGPVDPQTTADENAALQLRLQQAPDALGPDLNRPFFQSLPDAPSFGLPGALQYDPNALTGPDSNLSYGAGTGAPRLPADTSVRTDNQVLAPGAIDLTKTFGTDDTPTQADIAAQYGNTGLGGFQNLMAGGGAPPTPAEQVANRFLEGPGPDLNRPFFQSSPDAPSYQLPGRLSYDPNALKTGPDANLNYGAGTGVPRLPADTSNLGPKSVTPEIVRPPGGAGPAGPGTGPQTPGTEPGAPETPGVPPDTGGGRAPAQAPLDALGGGGGIAGLGGDQIPRGQFERGPPPSGLPPAPQVVNAMLSNASPAVQQAAQGLNPTQQTQVTQFAFGLINQYRQMLENQGAVADPSSPVWQQQILPQVRSQTQQFVLQLTGRPAPQAVNQIISTAA